MLQDATFSRKIGLKEIQHHSVRRKKPTFSKLLPLTLLHIAGGRRQQHPFPLSGEILIQI
jgi:hypothetical protein